MAAVGKKSSLPCTWTSPYLDSKRCNRCGWRKKKLPKTRKQHPWTYLELLQFSNRGLSTWQRCVEPWMVEDHDNAAQSGSSEMESMEWQSGSGMCWRGSNIFVWGSLMGRETLKTSTSPGPRPCPVGREARPHQLPRGLPATFSSHVMHCATLIPKLRQEAHCWSKFRTKQPLLQFQQCNHIVENNLWDFLPISLYFIYRMEWLAL